MTRPLRAEPPADKPLPPPRHRHVLGMRVDATSYDDAVERICHWAALGQARYVCVAAVNNAVEAHDDAVHRDVVNGADLVTPDGMPLVWALRLLGVPTATRVYGPDLTALVCRRAVELDIPVGFYGGSPDVLDELVARLRADVPGLRVVHAESPPFRPLTGDEDAAAVEAIRASGARVVFVGLGAPKQERWMAEHVARLDAVLLGVGAAFDFIAGRKRQAPSFMRRSGLEWLFRLACEPRRLWRRYLVRNPRFVVLFVRQLRHDRVVWRREP